MSGITVHKGSNVYFKWKHSGKQKVRARKMKNIQNLSFLIKWLFICVNVYCKYFKSPNKSLKQLWIYYVSPKLCSSTRSLLIILFKFSSSFYLRLSSDDESFWRFSSRNNWQQNFGFPAAQCLNLMSSTCHVFFYFSDKMKTYRLGWMDLNSNSIWGHGAQRRSSAGDRTGVLCWGEIMNQFETLSNEKWT